MWHRKKIARKKEDPEKTKGFTNTRTPYLFYRFFSSLLFCFFFLNIVWPTTFVRLFATIGFDFYGKTKSVGHRSSINQLAVGSVPVRRALPALLVGLPLLVCLLACVRACLLVCAHACASPPPPPAPQYPTRIRHQRGKLHQLLTPIQLIHHKNVETPTTLSPHSIIFLWTLSTACYILLITNSRAFSILAIVKNGT